MCPPQSWIVMCKFWQINLFLSVIEYFIGVNFLFMLLKIIAPNKYLLLYHLLLNTKIHTWALLKKIRNQQINLLIKTLYQ